MKKLLIALFFLAFFEKNLFAAEAGMPQLDPEYWASQIFWLIIVFLSIYLLIAKIFIPKIKGSIDMRQDKIRKDLEEAKIFKENAEKKMISYKKLIETANTDARKVISESRQKLNEDLRVKKEEVQKKIDQEIMSAEKEIQKFKAEVTGKVNIISEEIVSGLIKDIFGEDLNKSSIKATVSQLTKEHESKKS
tara:strand:+ start:254 stop:829 length:576 start_codon:yes stop_codon:yes gene_type:complete